MSKATSTTHTPARGCPPWCATEVHDAFIDEPVGERLHTRVIAGEQYADAHEHGQAVTFTELEVVLMQHDRQLRPSIAFGPVGHDGPLVTAATARSIAAALVRAADLAELAL